MNQRATVVVLIVGAVLRGCGGQVVEYQAAGGTEAEPPDAGSGADAQLDGGSDVASEAGSGSRIECTGAPEGYELVCDSIEDELYSVNAAPDGTLLAGRGWDSVVQVTTAGEVVERYRAPASEDGGSDLSYRLKVSPAGNAFLVHQTNGNRLDAYDAEGHYTGTIATPIADESVLFAKFAEGGQSVLASMGYLYLEESVEDRLDIWSLDGQLIATLPESGGINVIPASAEMVVMSQGRVLSAQTFGGTALWEVELPGQILSYVASPDGTWFAVKVPAHVIHVDDAEIVATHELDSAIWDVALSPSGEWSAATQVDPGRVTLFRRGALVRTVELPVHYLLTVAVNDRGEVAVGAHDYDSVSHVYCLDVEGQVAWACAGPVDNSAFLPWVRFSEGGDAVWSLWRGGFRYFRMAQ